MDDFNKYREVFEKYLNVSEIIDNSDIFYEKIINYLKHSRNGEDISGRSISFIEESLGNLVYFLNIIGCSDIEKIIVIGNMPSILNSVEELYKKYLFLGVVCDNGDIRKDKIVNHTKDYMCGLKTIYKRYCLVRDSGYNKYTWNVLVHSTDDEFANIFITGTYSYRHKIFSSKDDVDKWLSSVNVDNIDWESIKKMDVNKEIVNKYENKGRKY